MATQPKTKTSRARIATALWVIAIFAGLVAALLAHPGARESIDRLDAPMLDEGARVPRVIDARSISGLSEARPAFHADREAPSRLDEPPADTDIVRW